MALLELGGLGWHVTEIRPDRDAPVLWRVTIKRYDGFASISVKDADPDDALDELLRYACVDAEGPRSPITVARERAPAADRSEHTAATGPEEP